MGAVSQSLPKVLHFRQSSNIWGPEKSTLGLCRIMPAYGFFCEIAIMYRRNSDEPAEHPLVAAARAQGTPITQLDGRPRGLPASLLWLRRKLEAGEYAVLHAHEYKTDLLAALAAGRSSRRVPALVATVRHTEPGFLMGLLQGLDSLLLHRFDRLTAPSRAALGELRGWPALLRKTRVIHHAAGASLDGPPERVAELPQHNGCPVISIVGRLQAVKGHRLFLESARRVLAKKPEAKFWIVGEGELRGELQAAASQWDLTHAVTFLGYRNDPRNVMTSSDVVVCASSYESFPQSSLEALALGRPLVATSVGGLVEVVRDGETGILVPPGDPDSMAAAILRLLDDRELARRMGAAGRDFITQTYTLEAQAAALAALYHEALALRQESIERG
jgi:glycosyltransferase involved in cell wall biosynthesis